MNLLFLNFCTGQLTNVHAVVVLMVPTCGIDTKGRTIQPKLDRTDPVKSAASKSAIQYRSGTDSGLPWTVRKYTPISKRKCKTLHKWCGARNSAVSG